MGRNKEKGKGKKNLFEEISGPPERASKSTLSAHSCWGKAYVINDHGIKGHIAASQG